MEERIGVKGLDWGMKLAVSVISREAVRLV